MRARKQDWGWGIGDAPFAAERQRLEAKRILAESPDDVLVRLIVALDAAIRSLATSVEDTIRGWLGRRFDKGIREARSSPNTVRVRRLP